RGLDFVESCCRASVDQRRPQHNYARHRFKNGSDNENDSDKHDSEKPGTVDKSKQEPFEALKRADAVEEPAEGPAGGDDDENRRSDLYRSKKRLAKRASLQRAVDKSADQEGHNHRDCACFRRSEYAEQDPADNDRGNEQSGPGAQERIPKGPEGKWG